MRFPRTRLARKSRSNMPLQARLVRRNPQVQLPDSDGAVVVVPINPFALSMAESNFDVRRRYPIYKRHVISIMDVLDKHIQCKNKVLPKRDDGPIDETELYHLLNRTFQYQNDGLVIVSRDLENALEENGESDRLYKLVTSIYFNPKVPFDEGKVYLPIGLQEEYFAAGGDKVDFGVLNGREDHVFELRRSLESWYTGDRVQNLPAPYCQVGDDTYFLLNGPETGNSFSLAPLAMIGNTQSTDAAIIQLAIQSGFFDEVRGFTDGEITFALPIINKLDESSVGPHVQELTDQIKEIPSRVRKYIQACLDEMSYGGDEMARTLLRNFHDQLPQDVAYFLNETEKYLTLERKTETLEQRKEYLRSRDAYIDRLGQLLNLMKNTLTNIRFETVQFVPFASSEGNKESFLGASLPVRDITSVRTTLAKKFSGSRKHPLTLFLVFQLMSTSADPAIRKLTPNVLNMRSTFTVEKRTEKTSQQASSEEKSALGLRAPRGREPVKNYFPIVPTMSKKEGKLVNPLREVVFTVYGMLDAVTTSVMKARNEAMGGGDTYPVDSAYAAWLSGINSSENLKDSFNRLGEPGESTDMPVSTRPTVADWTIPAKYATRVTPDNIDKLDKDEIFVFGSNTQGIHGAGAALKAKNSFGARERTSEGRQGSSYAIVTKKTPSNVFSAEEVQTIVRKSVEDFLKFTQSEKGKKLKFYVTPVGTGLAGIPVETMARFFADAKEYANVLLPKSFWKVLLTPVAAPASPAAARIEEPSVYIVGPEFARTGRHVFEFDGRNYASMEHAFQSNKNGFDLSVYARPDDFIDQIFRPTSLDPSAGVDLDNLLSNIVRSCFEQNAELMQRLLATGKQGTDGKWIWKKLMSPERKESKAAARRRIGPAPAPDHAFLAILDALRKSKAVGIGIKPVNVMSAASASANEPAKMISKIISGGQTGADQGGLAAAVSLQIQTGGTAPKGYKTQSGPAPWLRELGLAEHSSPDYPPRTKQNILDSDGTLIFGDISSRGCALTKKLCNELAKPCIFIEWRSGEKIPEDRIPDFIRWLKSHRVETLNVAGNREESQNGIFESTRDFLVKAIQAGSLKPPTLPSSAVINVMFKGGPKGSNSALSNLARRPFTFDGRQYQSVEHAYQTLKNNFDAKVYTRPHDFVGKKKSPPKLRSDSGIDTDQLMKDLVLASFQQNPTAAMELLATGDARFTHVSTSGRTDHWTTAFPQILEQVRSELRAAKSAPNPRHRHAVRYRSVLNPQGFGLRGRRNPSLDQYGIFYQVRLTQQDLADRIAVEKYNFFHTAIVVEESQITPWPDFHFDAVDDAASKIIAGTKKFVTHTHGLPAGRVVRIGVPTAFDRRDFFARSRGALTFSDFALALGANDDGKDRMFMGINRWAKASGYSLPAGGYKTNEELANAVIDDDTTLLDTETMKWVLGQRTAVVYDISEKPIFMPLATDFSPYLAMRKVICDMAWISDGGEPSRSCITRLFGDEEEEDAPKLKVPFSIFGVLKADLQDVALLDRDLPPPFRPDGRSRYGLYTFNVKVPTPYGKKTPDAAAIARLIGSDQDGVKAVRFTIPKFVTIMTSLVQVAYNTEGDRMVPMIGTPLERPDLFSAANIMTSTPFNRVHEAIVKKEEDKDPKKKRSPEALRAAAYYAVVSMAVRMSNKPRSDENAEFNRLGYFAVGGIQVSEANAPRHRQWATEDQYSFRSVYEMILSLATGERYEPVREKLGVIAALRQKQILPAAELPSEDEEEGLFTALSRLAGEGSDVPSVRRFQNQIRLGQRTEAWVDDGYRHGLQPGNSYLISVNGKLFEVSVAEDQDHEGSYFENGMRLGFSPVEDQSQETRLISEAAKHSVKIPYVESISLERPTDTEGKLALARARLQSIQEQKQALRELRDRMDNNYRHTMNIGQLKEQLQGTDIGRFAIPFLEELAKPNPQVQRNPGSLRRNPIQSEALIQAMVEYANGQLSADDINKLKNDLQNWAQEQGPASKWALSPAAVRQMFPREGKMRPDGWSPQTRITEGLGPTGHNIVSRVSRLQYTDEDRNRARAAATSDLPFNSDESSTSLLQRQAELSLDEAKQMLDFQRDAVTRRSREDGIYTIQASSALCKTYRKRRLSTFAVPGSILRAFEANKNLPYGELSTILILMSPRSTEQQLKPRIMVWRRGDHIDCDMVGNEPEDLTEMLGKAIQSSLLWLAEKPVRRQQNNGRTFVFVGRVGSNKLHLAWSPGDEITIAKVTENLRKPAFDLTGDDIGSDITRYINAEKELQIGTFKPAKKTKKTDGSKGSSGGSMTGVATAEEAPAATAPAAAPTGATRKTLDDILPYIKQTKMKVIGELSSGTATITAENPTAKTSLGNQFNFSAELEGETKLFSAVTEGDRSLKYNVNAV